jgi:hypothetical protein
VLQAKDILELLRREFLEIECCKSIKTQSEYKARD